MIKYYHIFGISMMIALWILVITSIYIPASFNEKGTACVFTNLYGEHWIEFILLITGFFAFIHFVWCNQK